MSFPHAFSGNPHLQAPLDARPQVHSGMTPHLSKKFRFQTNLSICVEFEEKYDLNSNEFLQQFEAGELGNDADFFDWFAAKRGFDHWTRKYKILTEY